MQNQSIAHPLRVQIGEKGALFFTLSFIFFTPFSTALMNVSLVLALLFLLIKGGYKNHINTAWNNPIAKASLLLFTFIVIGTHWSIAEGWEPVKMVKKYNALWYVALLTPIFISFKRQELGVNVFLSAMILLLCIIYAIYFQFIGPITIHITDNHYTSISITGGFKSDIITNIFMAFSAFVLMQRSAFRQGFYKYIYILLAGFFIYYALFISSGTTGQILTIGLISLFLIQHFKWRSVLLIPVILSGIVLYGTSANIQSFDIAKNKAIDTVEHSKGSGSQRREFWENSVHLIKENLWLGTGTGSFEKRYSQLANERIQTHLTSNPHNEYINIAMQLGLVGAVLLLALFSLQLYYAFQIINIEYRYIAQGFVALISVASLGNSILMDSGESHFWVFFTVLLFTQKMKLKNPSND